MTAGKDKVPVWLISMLKGGVCKSTTVMMLAFALADSGKNVLVVDADHGTQGVTDWASRVYAQGDELPFDVVQWAPSLGLLMPFLQKSVNQISPDVALIDVGGEAPEVLRQIVLAADRVISPVGSETGEISRMPATASIIRPTGVTWDLLLTRVPAPGLGRARLARRELESEGYSVLTTEIPRNLEVYSDVWGTLATPGVYADLADELIKGSK